MLKTVLVGISLVIAAGAVFSAPALARPARGKQALVVAIEVTSAGFVPSQIKAKVNQPIRLVVTRKTDRTCAKEIVIKDYGIHQPLPLNQAVEVAFTPTKPGEVRYACGMNMIAGAIIVE